ncbi:uncharacterized protein LOC124809235 isoform X2 [Hydra vulgaris]|uniref:uncharacterized protein LOC124809235 isoform X2 n=1 Tax=Hydra vulgaris TaxID=6087 RepID=UPI001F5FF2CA|nr:uncharacterized protein LOC124809235 isoform X2 [Hydra vulgaris]
MSKLQDISNCSIQPSECWRENSEINVSLADRYHLSIGDEGIVRKVKKKTYLAICYKHFFLLFFMFISILVVIFPIIVLIVYKDNLEDKVRNTLILLLYIGIFSFSGGVATLVSLLVLSPKVPRFSSNYLNERAKIVRQFLDEIFSEEYIWQYSKRTKFFQDNNNSQTLVSFLESNEFDNWISKKFQSMLNTPQGVLLDVLDIDHDEACSTFKFFIMKTVLEFPKQISELWNHSSQRQSLKSHINNVLLERLSSDSIGVNQLTQQMVVLQIDYIVIFVTLVMGIFGGIFGTVITFLLYEK